MDYDAFLSHHSADKPLIRELRRRLQAQDLRVWLDDMDNARQAMGTKRFDAAQALGRAERTAEWPTMQGSVRLVAVADATGRWIAAYTLDQNTHPDALDDLDDFQWTLATLISP